MKKPVNIATKENNIKSVAVRIIVLFLRKVVFI
jgi:hypothetical protein